MKKRSLNKAFFLCSVLLILLISVELMFVLHMAYSLFGRYRTTTTSSVLQVYSQSIDSRLSNVNQYMSTLLDTRSDVRLMGLSTDERLRFEARKAVSEALSTLLQLEPMISGTVCWSGDESVAVSSRHTMQTNTTIEDAVARLADEERQGTVNAGWRWMEIDGSWYLINVRDHQECQMAVWMELTDTADAGSNDPARDHVFFCRQDGQIIRLSADGGLPEDLSDRNILTIPSGQGQFEYCCDLFNIRDEAYELLITILICCLLIGLTVYAAVGLLRHMVKRVFQEIHAGLEAKGRDASCVLAYTGRVQETDEVLKTLDEMSGKILRLQQNVYCHEINEQKARLQALHMQINSHFFSNCMNIIFSLAQVKKTALIQDFTIYLIDYLHYLNTAFKSSSALSDELKHLNNYLQIQCLRYPGRVSWTMDVDPAVEEYRILPLILLTFIENIFKHGMLDRPLTVTIRVSAQTRDGRTGLYVCICDDGAGIRQEKADALNAFNFSENPDFDHKSGIEKTLARMQIYYGSLAAFRIGRRDPEPGTVVELFLPQAEP